MRIPGSRLAISEKLRSSMSKTLIRTVPVERPWRNQRISRYLPPVNTGSKLIRRDRVPPITPARPQKIPVHGSDHFQLDPLRTNGLAFPDIRAAPEYLVV